MDEPLLLATGGERCGWKTVPFIIGAMMGVGMVTMGVSYNLEVYLVNVFNIGRIDATQIFSIASGCISLAPVLGGLIADSLLGCSAVLAASTVACFLSMILFTLTAAISSLHPPPCSPTVAAAAAAAGYHSPTAAQLAVLFTAIALLAVGIGGTRYNGLALGANQLSSPSERSAFFNWYLIALYLSPIAGGTIFIYAQDSLGWPWGFSIGTAIAALAALLYFCGRPYKKPPLTNESRELKPILKLLPLISSGILLSATISIQTSMTVLQALAMDRRLAPGLLIPAGSVNMLVLAAAAASITAISRASEIQPLRRIGAGHVINAVAMAVMAVTEWRRRAVGPSASVMWLVPALVLVGVGEGFHYPGEVLFYCQEFPAGMRSTATGMMAVLSGGGFYVSAGLVAAVRWGTGWLKDDLDESRLDKLYAMTAAVGVLNFGYFLLCAWVYIKKGRRGKGGMKAARLA